MIKIDKGYFKLSNGTLCQLLNGYIITENGYYKSFPQTIDISTATVTLSSDNFIYNGSAQAPTIASVIVEEKSLISNVDYVYDIQSSINVGVYTITITGIGDYEGTIMTSYTISKLSLTKPTVSGSFTYNGSAQSCTISNMNSTYITQSGTTSATNAATRTITFTLKDPTNTQWADGTTAAVSGSWTIAKAASSISVSKSMLMLDTALTSDTNTFSYTGDGSLSVSSNATSIATVSMSGTTVTVTKAGTGTATITVKIAAGTNYKATSKTFKVYANDIFTSYSGTFTRGTTIYTIDSTTHVLYTLTTTGNLNLAGEAKFWICGGGANGNNYSTSGNGYGGGGGGYIKSGTIPSGNRAVTIGSAGGASVIYSNTALYGSTGSSSRGGNGGSGGGAPGYGTSTNGTVMTGGNGSGVNCYPYGLTTLKAHCAGGGGGSKIYATGNTTNRTYYSYYGGNGGSNGAAGNNSTTTKYTTTIAGRNGGSYGGGKGGGGTNGIATNATFYGSGGGGRSNPRYWKYNSNSATYSITYATGTAGKGYQGVCYIFVPI